LTITRVVSRFSESVDVHSFASRAMPGFYVAGRVANHPRMWHINIVFAGGLQQHSRLRFAAIAGRSGFFVRTVVNRIDIRAVLG